MVGATQRPEPYFFEPFAGFFLVTLGVYVSFLRIFDFGTASLP